MVAKLYTIQQLNNKLKTKVFSEKKPRQRGGLFLLRNTTWAHTESYKWTQALTVTVNNNGIGFSHKNFEIFVLFGFQPCAGFKMPPVVASLILAICFVGQMIFFPK